MTLDLSRQQRDEMLGRWFDLIVGAYPDETERFLREQADEFANPVGAALREELGPILDGVLSGCDPVELEPPLDRVIRVRALQDMSPAEAVAFILQLKPLFAEIGEEVSDVARAEFERRVDTALLTAFNVYSRCREQVFDIRVKEIKNRSLKMMERLNSWREQRVGDPLSNA